MTILKREASKMDKSEWGTTLKMDNSEKGTTQK